MYITDISQDVIRDVLFTCQCVLFFEFARCKQFQDSGSIAQFLHSRMQNPGLVMLQQATKVKHYKPEEPKSLRRYKTEIQEKDMLTFTRRFDFQRPIAKLTHCR